MNRRTRPTRSSFDPAFGLELEMGVAHGVTGRSLAVDRYFQALQARLKGRESEPLPWAADRPPGAAAESPSTSLHHLDGRIVAVSDAVAEYGLDNGFNLLEISTRPVRESEGGLCELERRVKEGLGHVLAALEADEATVLNASQHPDCPRDAQWYDRTRVPRPIYRELVGYRGWRHWEGIDAKAQNGANVQVRVEEGARALNVMIGLAAAHVALFANSPLESGEETGWKENRLTIWPRVFRGSRFAGDAMLAGWPPRPFLDLGDYFKWMFRPGTVSRSLPLGRDHDYKGAASVLLEGDPCLSTFLHAYSWPGRRMDTGERVELVPETSHFEHSQIAQFMDARLRYRLETLPPLDTLLRAWERSGGLETLFAECGAALYIEGRCPGAGFADPALREEAGSAVADSIVMSPIALQAGLLRRLDDAERLMARRSWATLHELRLRAQRDSVADPDVARLCREVLEVASDGLAPGEQPYLAYVRYVLESGRCGADRLLETWRGGGDDSDARLARLVARHHAQVPGRLLGGQIRA